MKRLAALNRALLAMWNPICLRALERRRSLGRGLLHVGCTGLSLDAFGTWGLLPIPELHALHAIGIAAAAVAGIAAYLLQ